MQEKERSLKWRVSTYAATYHYGGGMGCANLPCGTASSYGKAACVDACGSNWTAATVKGTRAAAFASAWSFCVGDYRFQPTIRPHWRHHSLVVMLALGRPCEAVWGAPSA